MSAPAAGERVSAVIVHYRTPAEIGRETRTSVTHPITTANLS